MVRHLLQEAARGVEVVPDRVAVEDKMPDMPCLHCSAGRHDECILYMLTQPGWKTVKCSCSCETAKAWRENAVRPEEETESAPPDAL